MSIVNNIQYIHKIIDNDPIILKSYINSRIEVTMKNCNVHQGILYTVDPVSESVVLVERENEEYQMKIIVGHSIKEVRVISDPGLILPQLFLVSKHQAAETELVTRKMQITKLFEENRFTITENNGILEIAGMLFIEPPYRMEDCICTNPIILNRVQNIMSQIPIS